MKELGFTKELEVLANHNGVSFIRSFRVWSDEEEAAFLVICHFDQDLYSKSDYRTLDVFPPDGLRGALKKRQAEFLAGRYAAKIALEASNNLSGDIQIPIGQDRSPTWPRNTIGSISHSEDTAMCVVTKNRLGKCIGIDYEPYITGSVAAEIAGLVCQEREVAMVMQQGLDRSYAINLIFSAKECLFKALYPKVRKYFDFAQAQVVNPFVQNGVLQMSLNISFAREHGLELQYRIKYCNYKNGVLTLLQHNQ